MYPSAPKLSGQPVLVKTMLFVESTPTSALKAQPTFLVQQLNKVNCIIESNAIGAIGSY